jgi:hypothetical protein
MVSFTYLNYRQIIYDIQNDLDNQYRELASYLRVKESKRIINKLKKDIKNNEIKLSHYQTLLANLDVEHIQMLNI